MKKLTCGTIITGLVLLGLIMILMGGCTTFTAPIMEHVGVEEEDYKETVICIDYDNGKEVDCYFGHLIKDTSTDEISD